MGLKTFTIGVAREAFELICDGQWHGNNVSTAWIDCGSLSGNSSLATTIGWNEVGRRDKQMAMPAMLQREARQAKPRESMRPRESPLVRR
jgi:hypothetical protein